MYSGSHSDDYDPLFSNQDFVATTTSMRQPASNFSHLYYDATHSGPSQIIDTPYVNSMSYDPSFASYFFGLDHYQPQVSFDGMATLPAGTEDVPALKERLRLPFEEPFRLDEMLHIQPPKLPLPIREDLDSSLPTHPKSNLQFHPYTGVSQAKLRGFAAITKDTLDTQAEPSQSTLQPIGPSVYDKDNTTHGMIFKNALESLIKDAVNVTPFLSEKDKKQHVQQVLIGDVVFYIIVELDYLQHITDPTLKSLFCTASAAVKCALQERLTGQEVKFTVTDFKPTYNSFSDYIDMQIVPYPELLAWWNNTFYYTCVVPTIKSAILV
ncbi:uncharacterized protein EDB91DRAFT_1078555 [Suillus paluster]|uniref:uncharacterized protein n=1 Tax=Suillus paluster TaxID=48578 RepID=UPI001B86E683|nr:uncharacterized protein EDB91DRAFT_1078555 [Suillus paluster]KAG1750535.1 hypothetical protein EDB91DRAFT_1078555 [Suillus paluster]